MQKNTLSLLCNPYLGEPFKLEGDYLIGIASGQKFPIVNGIPMIYYHKSHSWNNKWNRWQHDRSAFAYDTIMKWGDLLKINSEEIVRKTYIQNFNIKSGDKVLETAIGTANNLNYLPAHGDYFGQDISIQMLKIAQRKVRKSDREIELFQGDGAYIPFQDNTFDLVFQMGGLQFYEDPFRGVSEMARTAKNGTTIHILDEVRGAMKMLKGMPAHEKYSHKADTAVKAMARLVPHSMQSISSGIIQNSNFYYLRFDKP